MGGNSSKGAPTYFTNESYNSTRNILEGFAKGIKDDIYKNANKKGSSLKGNLKDAKFYHNFSSLRKIPTSPCDLDFWFHTNVWKDKAYERDPCYGRQAKNNSKLEGAVCTNSKIKGNENKIIDTGACAPYRRRNICDYNLEHIHEGNVLTTHDLLGNVLVMAKNEGASIVNSQGNNGTLNVCTTLARSFADIGDIIRGKDLYLGKNESEKNTKKKLQGNLEKIFKKFKEKYGDIKDVQIDDIREYWWALNRKDVWKALTCNAPNEAQYFIKSDASNKSFSNENCGHNKNGDPLTNLDYVPQFLRWFEEWAEHFCLVRKHKLENVKQACRGEKGNGYKKYCSGDGYDCTRTNLKKNTFYVDIDCPNCEKACRNYQKWIENQENEFSKQKEKYEKEIVKEQNNDNNKYVQDFYKNLKTRYPSKKFLETLKEVPQCSNHTSDSKIDFNNSHEIFTTTNYCETCPPFGVTCNEKSECKPNKGNESDSKKSQGKITDIDVLVTHVRGTNIFEDLKDCKKYGLFKGIRKQQWKCQYKNPYDECNVSPFVKNIDVDNRILFKVLFERWLKYFIQDFNNVKDKINRCTKIEHGKDNKCIKGCKNKCECVENWIKIKEVEWKKINQHYKQNSLYKYSVPRWVNSFLTHEYFSSDFINALEDFKSIRALKNLKQCSSDTCKINKIRNINEDLITELISKLKDKIATCKYQNDDNNGQKCCDKLPKSENDEDDEEDDEDDVAVSVGEKKNVKQNCAGKESDKMCETVKTLLENNDGSNEISGCNPKTKGEYPQWQCGINSKLVNEDGVCMPPRRQKFCVYDITEKDKLTKEDDIRTKFINCAAKETHFAWHKYIIDNKEAHKVLKSGKIPDDFLRSMKYNFGDFRDIFFGTDISSCPNIKKASENIKTILKKENDEEKKEKQMLDAWTNSYGPKIWKAMLCALTNGEKKNEIKTMYSYDKLNITTNGTPSLEEFAQRPQFLRWMTEWSEHFCREREEKETEVEKQCTSDYAGCKDSNGRSNCAKACEAYKKYITDKEKEYTTQKTKFNSEKTKGNGEYKNYTKKEPHEYLKDKCLDKKCNCIEKVKDSSNYWEKPFQTYDDNKLNNKCECPAPAPKKPEVPPAKVPEAPKKIVPAKKAAVATPKKQSEAPPVPPPCTIVDDILGDKSSSGYAEGCKTKYGTMTRSEWLCNSSGGKGESGGGKESDVVCIPPRRQRLFVQKLHDLTVGTTTSSDLRDDLRRVFIESAAVETFFSWHEYKKEKKKEKEEQNTGLYGSTPEDTEQKQLEGGEIPEEFKRQMFYTLADYRDILFGKDISKDKGTLNEKIHKIFANGGKNPSVKTRQQFWELYGPDIWDGMLCALSYNTETKKKDESVSKKLTESGKNNDYNNVSFQGGFDNNRTDGPRAQHDSATTETKLTDFEKRPPFFRWLEEWAEEFCRKQKHKLKIIASECDKDGNRNCDEDGFDCDEMGPKEDGSFETLKYPSCAKSCKSYKKWINTKKDEFNKQKEKYPKEINNDKNKSDSTYDKEFVANLKTKYTKATDFLDNLKGGPCKYNNGNDEIKFNDTSETFKHAENCKTCTEFKINCPNGNCRGGTNEKCNGRRVITKDDIETMGTSAENVVMLVSDKSAQTFPNGLENVCKGKDIFNGIKENKWSCGYVCGVDVCKPEKGKEDIDNKQYIPIRVLFKRWVENFLEDYNKINDKVLHCMKNGEKSTCINGCNDKCKCVEKWIGKKKFEWQNIKKRFFDQYKIKHSEVYPVKSFLEESYFHNEVQKAIEPFENINDFEDTCGGTDPANSNNPEDKKKDVVVCLLNKLEEKIKTCQAKHKVTTDKQCSDGPRDTTHISDDILPPGDVVPPPYCNIPGNPCGNSGATNVVNVKEVAEEMQVGAQTLMLQRSGKKDGEDKSRESGEKVSALKGDIKKAEFKNGAKPNGLNGKEICNINTSHSNGTGASTDPCNGKGDRFTIGTTWKDGDIISKNHKDVYMPPRREHFCTSNLEKLNVNNVKNSSNVNASFLVDVLLAAKYEAERTKNHYRTKSDEHPLACRALRYSFADIGDIIQGRDMWDKNVDFYKLEGYLVEIFGKIKEEIKKQLKDELNSKYNSDTDIKHTQLRSDWWEANRDQIWEAMQCKTTSKSGSITCDKEPTPIDDHIPQRLRWMTEWAEWYCKMQKEEYDKLKKQCGDCRSKGKQCMNGETMCTECMTACDTYKENIKKWEEQWKEISKKYKTLYEEAKKGTKGSALTKQDQEVVAFLKKLYEKNKGSNEIYATAEGYVHQEAHISECQKQTLFCTKTSGETSPSSKDNDKYAFRDKPYDNVEACNCEKNKPKPISHVRRWSSHWRGHWKPFTPPEMFKKRMKKKATCEIVEEILGGNNATTTVGECHQKGTDSGWNCDENNIKSEHRGACMPPRRQKLCLHYLKQAMKNTDDLKNAFIKCAAAETFLLWQKYKKDKNGGTNDLDNTLKGGTIPEDFKRQMLYTFGDYRDLCLGTDISLNKAILSAVSIAKNNINAVFSMIGQRSINDRKIWWEKNTKDIWEGMLCALSYDTERKKIDYNVRSELTDAKNNNTFDKVTFGSDGTSTLSKFSEQPQFFRWFTEWGDKFCRERIIKIKDLETKCSDCNVVQSAMRDGIKTCDDKDKCDTCKEQCKKYKEWLGMWKTQYITQRKKYTAHNVKDPYKSIDDVTRPKHAYQYLNEQLKQFTCENGDCNCMENASKESQTKESMKGDMPASLEDTPSEYKDKCNCIRDECTGLSVTDSGFADFSAFGGGVSDGKCNELKGGSPKKIETPQHDPTNDILKSTIPVGIALVLGSIAFLFMKKKPKHPVGLLRVLDIPKGDYDIPTLKSKNRYIPYRSDPYKGKTYIYMEGDSSGDEKYAFMSDTTDITSSSESEYEEMDINDIYVPGSPKYKTLIEVVLEPSHSGDHTPSDTPSNKFTEEEWNQLKDDFISQYLPNTERNNNYRSADITMNTQAKNLRDSMEEKPFIMSIHDRNLLSGEEISYNINMNTNTTDDTKYESNNVYSGIDLINDTLSGNKHIDIYDEVLKRKENELFGTKHHPKRTSYNSVSKNTNSDPIMNQLDLLHKWLDRHRDMCEKWNNKEDILNKLYEQWNKDNDGGNVPNGNRTLNTDVSIEIDMDYPKPINQFSNMDTNVDTPTMDNMENDIYYDVNDDENPSVDDIPMDHNKVDVDVPKKVHVEMKILNNTSNGSLEQQFPISDVWNI
ncbi:erythrocyte membrane protein 1, PfEMP1, putative [Plasmodium reichenowi]|uniref:Erythrocyte membrane protein 1, PfEMP1, putative n=1 Tax=Plasmodium reichenowi TaxID=5854 RepID=A0A2P9D9D9_PLARE|nr:erythrocyte membrane protein 1, PfEMP1, putative [Plasmodium reichenowi]